MPLDFLIDENRGGSVHWHLQILLYHGMPGSGRKRNVDTNLYTFSQYFNKLHSPEWYRNPGLFVAPFDVCPNGIIDWQRNGPFYDENAHEVVPMHVARDEQALYNAFEIPHPSSLNAPQMLVANNVGDLYEFFGASQWDGRGPDALEMVYVKRIIVITPPDYWSQPSGESNYDEFISTAANNSFGPLEDYIIHHGAKGRGFGYVDIKHIYGDIDVYWRPNANHIRCNMKKQWFGRNNTVYNQRLTFYNNSAETYRDWAMNKGVRSFIPPGVEMAENVCNESAIGLAVLPSNIANPFSENLVSCAEFGVTNTA